jgi:biopolymer transport protein ExbB/TolQ
MNRRAAESTSPEFALRFRKCDPEARIGLPRGRYSNPSLGSSSLLAALAMAITYAVSYQFSHGKDGLGPTVWRYLTDFDRIPIFIAALTFWSLSILLLKFLKIRAQRRALSVRLTPRDPMWVLNGSSADSVIATISATVEEPEQFMYLRRVLGVLRTMRNVGRIADVDELFESRAGADEAVVDSGYTPVKAFIWGIPVLGFIGTVIGLTAATANFGKVLSDPEMKKDLEALAAGLTSVLGGLDTAFVTTAEGLIAAFFLYMAQMFVKQQDERLLDDVRDACSMNIVTKVRITDSQART